MKIYIDSDYKCHVTNDGTMREFEVFFFDGKCPEFIEGYRYIPPGEHWISLDGMVYRGERKSLWKDYSKLWRAQAKYELAQYEAALTEIETALGVVSE